jgi:hypothetical protein
LKPAAPIKNIPSNLTSTENHHETPIERLPSRTRYHQSARRAGGHVQGTGLEQSLIELVTRLADQRLRLLYQHAHPGRAQARRNRAAAVSVECVGGSPRLYRPGTRRAGVDRGGNAGFANPRARRRLRGRPQAILGRRDGQSDHAGCDHQRLEHEGGVNGMLYVSRPAERGRSQRSGLL